MHKNGRYLLKFTKALKGVLFYCSRGDRMKLLKVLLVAGIMFSGIIIPPTPGDDEPIPTPYCYAHDCHEFN